MSMWVPASVMWHADSKPACQKERNRGSVWPAEGACWGGGFIVLSGRKRKWRATRWWRRTEAPQSGRCEGAGGEDWAGGCGAAGGGLGGEADARVGVEPVGGAEDGAGAAGRVDDEGAGGGGGAAAQ